MKTPKLPTIAAGLMTLLLTWPAYAAETVDSSREILMTIERESHQRWLEGDVAALDELMWDEFHFIAMNGALETKGMVVGGEEGGERVLEITELRVEPEDVLFRGETAVVISLLHLEATVRNRPVPNRMRILSVFTRSGEEPGWRLMARSITPILMPPPATAGAERREQ